MSGLVEHITEVLEAHRWAWTTELHCRCGWFAQPINGGTSRDAHDAHLAAAVQDALLDAQTVTTPDQLNALPFLAVIREVGRNSPSGANYGGVYERRTSGWQCLAGVFKGPSDSGSPRLPCRLLWNPTVGASESAQ